MSTQLIVGLAIVAALIGLAVFFKIPGRVAGWWGGARTFLKETRSEVSKVTFPSRDDVVATTIVVIITSFVFAIFLTLSDAVINNIYGFVFEIFSS